MVKKRSGGGIRRHARVDLPVGRFLHLLHQSIGGAGPKALGESDSPAFRRDHPDHALTAEDFKTEYLWAHIMRKYDDGKASSVKADAALKSLLEAEDVCANSYHKFRGHRFNAASWPQLSQFATLDAVIFTATRKIERCLRGFEWTDALPHCGFGPGATSNLPRRRATRWHKFRALPESSTPCVSLVRWYTRHIAPSWRDHLLIRHGAVFSINDANRVTTVPKNNETDRPIAVEPQWNMFFQKGIGGLIRGRLRSVGVDLNDQTRNGKLAVRGSDAGDFATIDLSSASDTVSRWLVHELLPSDWVAAMERCRSPYSVLPSGERILLRKFSSMGNGYTFELESLIFWALASTVTQLVCGNLVHTGLLKERRIGIYGDDIIVPTEAYGPLIEVLNALGFIPNAEKSFGAGPFRESCGKHAFQGYDVTPFYIRRPVNTLEDLFLLHNNLVRWAARNPFGVRDARVRELANWVRSHAPSEWKKPRLCDGYGDGAFIGSFDECTPKIVPNQKPTFGKAGNGHQGYDIRVKATRVIAPNWRGTPRLLSDLWALQHASAAAVELGPTWTPCLEVSGLAPSYEAGSHVILMRVWKWSELGPWVQFQEGSCDLRGLPAD